MIAHVYHTACAPDAQCQSELSGLPPNTCVVGTLLYFVINGVGAVAVAIVVLLLPFGYNSYVLASISAGHVSLKATISLIGAICPTSLASLPT